MAKEENKEVTSEKAASAAAKILRDPKASKDAKSSAGSALTQRSGHSNNEVTSKRVASIAAKVLQNPKASKATKTAAGSALTQRPGRGKK